LPAKRCGNDDGEEEGELRFVALLVHERPKLNPLKVLERVERLEPLNY
jgi:hypothetical protein